MPTEEHPTAPPRPLAGAYALDRELGRGGMATVYLAHDRKHDRKVAVKVLHPELAASLAAERFLQEIRVTATLQHPHILGLIDSGVFGDEAGELRGRPYYVMPFVDGETLRARLAREGPLAVAEAVRIATEAAGALDYAHRRGVVHRDVKPENVLLHEGQALVADFGIALAVEQAGGARMTQTGLSLGTPQYMAPEQAVGERGVDARADVYALGAVLYEMLAGEPPFTGASVQAILARVVTEAPRPLAAQRRTVPPHVEAAVLTALEKLPADRWPTARRFAEALAGGAASAAGTPSRPAAGRAAAARRALPWALLAATAALAAAGWARHPAAVDLPTVRFPIAVGEGERALPVAGIPFAISPDDRLIAYVGQRGDSMGIMLRPVDEAESRPVAGGEGPHRNPTFSPDGRWIAATREGAIVRIAVGGGTAVPIASLNGALVSGMTWAAGDTLVASVGDRLVAIPVRGGAWRPISAPDTARGEVAQWGPRLLPDGKRLIYVSIRARGIGGSRIAVVPLAGGRPTITEHLGTTALGAAAGHALWVTVSGEVMALPLDALAGGARAEPVPVMDGVLVRAGGAAKAALSARGSLVYLRGEAATRVVTVDARGVATPLIAETRAFAYPRWSPDGRRVALAIRSARSSDIWLYEPASRTLSRVTTGGTNDLPEWTPDGTRVIYRSTRPEGTTIRWRRVDGVGGEEVLIGSEVEPYDAVMAPDGRTLVYRTTETARHPPRLVAVSLGGDRRPRPLDVGVSHAWTPRLSRDGRWLAFAADDGGTPEVYVSPFPGPGPRYQVSSGGGVAPVWSADGRALYYQAGRSLLAARVVTAPAFAVAARDTLAVVDIVSDPAHASYDAAPDGRGVTMLQSVDVGAQTLVVLGWERELRARLGARR